MIVGLQLVAEGRTEVLKGHEEASFYIGKVDNPLAILTYKDIPTYLDESFWSAYKIWNDNRLTNGLSLSGMFGNPIQRVVDIISCFQGQYENIIRG